MTNEEYLALHDGEEFYCVEKTLAFLPGAFKPPHKGHWEMVMSNLDADEIHIFISKETRQTKYGTPIEADVSEKIFSLYIKDYGLENKVITHVCNNKMPIISAVGFGNHRCKNCTIRIGSITNDEAAEREVSWQGIIKNFRYNKSNTIVSLPVAPKIQGARDIRANIDNLSKDMFPANISEESYKIICHLLNPTVYSESRKFISKFNILYENVMKSLIFEHGIGIKNNQPIELKNIEPTIRKFYDEILKPLGINYESLQKLGSTGKKDVSGDLDLALDLKTALKDSNSKDKFELADKIDEKCKEYGYQFNNVLDTRFQELQFGIPIVNQDGIAALDIIPTNNIEYSKFRFAAPGKGESNYKGVHRSDLMKSLFKICSHYLDDEAADEDKIEFVDKNGVKHEKVQYPEISFDPDGMIKQRFTYRGKKGNFTTSPRKLEELKEHLDISNVQEMINMLFGKDLYKPSDFNSFESIWNNVIFSESFPYKNAIPDIVVDFVNRFNGDMVWQLEDHKEAIPKEAINYINDHNLNNRIK